MGFRKEVVDRLNRIEVVLTQVQRVLGDKTPEIIRMEKQNRDLFNKLMSRDFQEYVNFNPEQWEGEKETLLEDSPLTDMAMAGEILSDEDIKSGK